MAALRLSPAGFARIKAVPWNRVRSSSSLISTIRSAPGYDVEGRKDGSPVSGAFRFHGHTLWQMSQPNCHGPSASASAGSMAPRCSMVRYEMQRRASSR